MQGTTKQEDVKRGVTEPITGKTVADAVANSVPSPVHPPGPSER